MRTLREVKIGESVKVKALKGSIILLSTIVVWFTSYFGFTEEGFRMLSEEELDMSILATLGSLVSADHLITKNDIAVLILLLSRS